jgi:hypothetical protein
MRLTGGVLHLIAQSAHFFQKKRPLRAALKEAREEGVSSGKAMQDDLVQARARTLVLEKSKNLEEG